MYTYTKFVWKFIVVNLLWYGYIYYIIFNLLLLVLVFSLLRLYLNTYLNYWFSVFILNRLFLSLILFFFFVSFTILNYSLDVYSEVIYINTNTFATSSSDLFDYSYMFFYSFSKLWSFNVNSLNLLQVYSYPFIYVFLVVTILSIVYCLSSFNYLARQI